MRSRLLFFATLIVAGCAPRTTPPAAPAPSAPAAAAPTADTATRVVHLRRPLPYPVPFSAEFGHAVQAGTRTASGKPGARYWQQWANYTIQTAVHPRFRRLDGREQIRYANNSPDTLSVLWVNLLQDFHAYGGIRTQTAEVTGGMELNRVEVMGRDLLETAGGPGYQITGTLMRITPPHPVAPGDTVPLAFEWTFEIPQNGLSGRMGYSGDNLFFLAYWYPQMVVYDDVTGWATDFFRGTAEFYSDFASYDVTIDVPQQWLVTATGTLTNANEVLAPRIAARMRRAEESDSVVHVVTSADLGRVTKTDPERRLDWHFVADSVRDFVFGVTDESLWDAARTAVGDRDGDGVTDYARVDAVYRETARNWVHAAKFAQNSIHFLSGFTGLPYPWPHMSAVEGAGIIGGGMEYPMMTLIGDYNQRGDSALYYVVAHEFGHMWVPMTVNTNERRYSWMDEGTTTFNEDNARQAYYPGTHPFQNEQRDYVAKALSGTEGPMMRWSDWQYEGAFSVASYAKPAAVLHALQGVLGKEVFLKAYHEFFRRWAFKHAYPWDLWKTFEDVSGEDLSWFWRSWYYESTQFGGPWVLDQAVAAVDPQDDGSTRITVHDNGWVPMPVRLTVTRADGTVTHALIPVDVWLSGRVSATVTVAPGAEVTRVVIDVGHWFPDANRRNNVWTK
jgi:hypothetical protein